MKTLILYATKYGSAQTVAEKIASYFEGAVLHNLKQGGIPKLDNFVCVILGSSVYAGTIHKEAKNYIAENEDKLRSKRLGLFICGMSPDEKSTGACFTANFSESLLGSATATAFLGGIFDPKKCGFLERKIYKMVAKQSEYADTIDYVKIEQFAEALMR